MRRHPYIFSIIVATLLSVVVWLIVPKEYAAITKVSDEYKEVDLAIGLDKITAKIRDAMGADNEGMDNMEVYCQSLKTLDFARAISKVNLPGKSMTYGQWIMEGRHFWQTKDTIQLISENINYNISVKQQSLTIQFKDREALVASQMLDSVTMRLQTIVTQHRRNVAESALRNIDRQRKEAAEKYHKIQEKYGAYSDSNYESNLESVNQKEKAFQDGMNLAYKNYQELTEQYVRQLSLTKRSYCSFAVIKSNQVPDDNDDYYIGYFICFVFPAILLVKSFRLYKSRKRENSKIDLGSISSPWSITLLIWGLILFLLLFRDPTLLDAPGSQFYYSLLLWLVGFCFSSILTYNLLPSKKFLKGESITDSIKMDGFGLQFFHLLLLFSIIMTPLYVKKVVDIVLMFGTEDFMSNVRELAVYGDAQVGILDYCNVINTALLLIAIWSYPRIKLWQLIWSCMGCLLNSIAIMEKGGMLLVFFCVVFVLFEKKIIKIRTIAILSVVMLFLFYGFNLMRAEEDSDYQNNETIFGFVAMYVLSPPVAYCRALPDLTPQFGGHCFPVVYYYLNKFGFGPYAIFDRLQEFVFVPVTTNVYTIFLPFFQDFGQKGVFAFGIVYGIMSGYLYRIMRNGSNFGKCAYLYLSYILVLQFFQENLFTVSLFVPRVMILVYLCTQQNFTFSFRKVKHAIIESTTE